METLAIRRVSVWLDEMAPEQGAFAHALEWASRIGLPLRGIISPLETRTDPILHRLGEGKALYERTGRCAVAPDKVEACAAACVGKGVSWDASEWQGPAILGIQNFLRPAELCVFGGFLPPRLKEELLRRSLLSIQTTVLVCPRSWKPVSRVLLLHQHHDPNNRFLESAVQMCRALQVTPVVLTVAQSEREASLRQEFAEELFARHHLLADFDFVIGCDVRAAVAFGTRFRRCSHVIVERQNAPFWWRWLRGDTMERLLGLSDSLTFLALPNVVDWIPSCEKAFPARTANSV